MTRQRLVRAAILSAICCMPAGSVAHAENEPFVQAAVDTTATTVGGRLTLTLDVTTPAGWFVTAPEVSPELGPFRVRSIREAERTEDHRRLVLALVATEAGDLEIPSISLKATHGSDPDGLEIASQPIRVTVTSNLSPEEAATAAAPGASGGPAPPAPSAIPGVAPEDGPQPADLKPALDAPRRWLPLGVAGVVLLLAALLAFRVVRWLRARNPEERDVAALPAIPARPAWEVALEELDAIRDARYVDRGALECQYEKVTEAIRRYLENRYGIHALECTTDDLRELLRGAAIPGELAARVLSLLSEADLIKFAKGIPDPAGAVAGESRARRIVLDTIPEPVREEAA